MSYIRKVVLLTLTLLAGIPMAIAADGEQQKRQFQGLLWNTYQGPDTCMYLLSGEQSYLLDSWADHDAGDCVMVTGIIPGECETQCPEESGCIEVEDITRVDGCRIDECGRLVLAMFGCIYFESPRFGKYYLNNHGEFYIGDTLRVVGQMSWCVTTCPETNWCVVVETMDACVLTPIDDTTWGTIKVLYR